MLRLKVKNPNYILILPQETTNFLILYFSNKFSKKLIEEELQFIVNSEIFRIIEERGETGSLSSQSSQLMRITPSVFWLEKEVGYKNGCFWEKFAPLRGDKKGVIYKMEKKEEVEMKRKEAFDLIKMIRDINGYEKDSIHYKAYTLAMEALEVEMNREAWIKVCEEIIEITFDEKQRVEYETRIKILKSLRRDK